MSGSAWTGSGRSGKSDGDVGHEAGEQRTGAREVGAHLGGRRGAQVPADGLHERLVRHDVLLVAAPRENGRAFVVQHARELDREPRLAHACVTADERDASTVGRERLRPPRPEHRQLGFSADERRIRLERRGERNR